jgi:hypothetical protein
MSQKLATALNECIERLPADGSAAEVCAAIYPAHAGQLVPLIQLAQAIRNLPRPEPPAWGLADVQAQVRRVARAKREVEQARLTRAPRRWVWRLVQVVAIVGVLIALSMGSVTVAAESLPGSPLYPVKRVAEQMQLWVTFEPQQRVALRLTLAERRANELVALAHRGRPVDQITLAVMLDETGIAIRQLQNLPPDAARTLLTHAQNVIEYQQICLVHIRPTAPEAALAAIDQAIRICEQRARLIQQMQQDLNRSIQSR